MKLEGLSSDRISTAYALSLGKAFATLSLDFSSLKWSSKNSSLKVQDPRGSEGGTWVTC